MFQNQSPYCSKNGLSRPLSSRNCARCCDVPNGSAASAASPGNRRSRLKANIVERTTTTTSWRPRLASVRIAPSGPRPRDLLLLDPDSGDRVAAVDEHGVPATVGERRSGQSLHARLRGDHPGHVPSPHVVDLRGELLGDLLVELRALRGVGGAATLVEQPLELRVVELPEVDRRSLVPPH